jgi:sucrose-phosphate synthase
MDKIIRSEEVFDKAEETFHFASRIAAERISMARAARIITSTEQERSEQYAHLLYRGAVDPAEKGKFAVVPPGVNLEVFGSESKSDSEERIAERVEARLQRDLLPERRHLATVVCSSRLDAKKNHLGLIRAWAGSEPLRGAANLVMVTRGVRDPLRSWQTEFRGEERKIFGQIVDQIRAGGLQGCVSAFDLNSQEELAACYRYLSRHRRGIFALSSLYEPFGLAPLEAMAAGLPAVVTRNGGPQESLTGQGETYGILVDPEDPQSIARGLLELAGNESRRQEMQHQGRRRVLQRYTWERTAQGYLGEFRRIGEGADAGRRGFEEPAQAGKAWLRELYYGAKEST